jgi:putative salt-induced outer membrane protein YdiY
MRPLITGSCLKVNNINYFIAVRHCHISNTFIAMQNNLFPLAVFFSFILLKTELSGEIVWDNRIAVNAALQKGNSSLLALGGDLKINRNNHWKNEWTFLAGGRYQVDNNDIIIQTGETSLRFAWSLTNKLYNFYRIALHHNRILQIRYQVLPSTGAGYWFSDTKKLKLLLEAGGGYTVIGYNNDSTTSDAVLQTRLFSEYPFLDHFTLGNNTYYFPGMSMHLVQSSTFFLLTVKKCAAKFELIVDYNSRPVAGLETTDYQLKSGIEWRF